MKKGDRALKETGFSLVRMARWFGVSRAGYYAHFKPKQFRTELQLHRITQSMSRKGDCLDNACAESFFGTLKSELPAQIFWNRAEAQREIFDYIEGFYNPRRSHSYLGYISPDQFELLGKAA